MVPYPSSYSLKYKYLQRLGVAKLLAVLPNRSHLVTSILTIIGSLMCL